MWYRGDGSHIYLFVRSTPYLNMYVHIRWRPLVLLVCLRIFTVPGWLQVLESGQAIPLSNLMTESLFAYISDCDTPPKIPWYYFYMLLSWFQIKKQNKDKPDETHGQEISCYTRLHSPNRSACVVKFKGLPRWGKSSLVLKKRRYFLFPENNASVKKVRYHKDRPLG